MFPVAVGITAGWMLLPITMENTSSLIWETNPRDERGTGFAGVVLSYSRLYLMLLLVMIPVTARHTGGGESCRMCVLQWMQAKKRMNKGESSHGRARCEDIVL